MGILIAACTDVGIQKETNQDSYCYKIAETSVGTVVMALICDGMGGLSSGEVASASVIKAFSQWFDNELPLQLSKGGIKEIQYRWDRIIKEQNQKIEEYGRNNKIQLGTTLSVILITGNSEYLIGHVGDSRIYLIKDEINQLTEDQTVVGREIKRGNMTPEQAENDPRKNVLLQCIGASKIVEPVFLPGKPGDGDLYLLCSDGFRHKVSDNEMLNEFNNKIKTEDQIEQRIEKLISINKQRGETDNITALAFKI